jgi:hypothetical protein
LGHMLLSIISNYTPCEDERGVQAMKNTSILFCTAPERLFAALERGS